MAALHRGVRDHASNWNDWDRNQKLVAVLMMLLDDEAPMMLQRNMMASYLSSLLWGIASLKNPPPLRILLLFFFVDTQYLTQMYYKLVMLHCRILPTYLHCIQ